MTGVNYSLVPEAQQQMSSWGQVPQIQVPQMLDYSFGTQSNQGLVMPNYSSIAGFGGGQGMTPGGGQGLQFGGYRATNGMQPNADAGFAMNIPTFALGLQGLNSLGSLYMGAKSLSLANKQFASAEKFSNANLANQTHLVNDTLQSRIKRIGSGNGTSAADMAAEYERRKLPTRV